MRPATRPLAALALLALAIPLWLLAGETAPPSPPRDGAEQTPVDAVQHAIDQLKASGKDVSGLQSDLDALKPDWTALQAKQRELQTQVESFRPRMEALMHKVQQAGGSGNPDESPIQGIQHGLDMLRSKGKDVTALQSELDGLKPDWLAIQAAKTDLEKSLTADQKDKQKTLEDKMHAFQPRAEALVKKLQEMAGTVDPGAPPAR